MSEKSIKYEDSGGRAREANDEAMAEAEAAAKAIEARVARGEDVPIEERKQARERIDRLREDRGKIEWAG